MTGALLMVVQGLSGNLLQSLGKWFIPTYALITVFFAPTTTLHIKDIATKNVYAVANVPWGLGSIAGTLSSVSYHLTKKIETAFSLPDDLKYHKTGSMMASHLIAEARTFHITNSEVAETMKEFVNQCVAYDMLLGTKYTMDDVKNSTDIWALVKENPSPARAFTYREPGSHSKPQILTCKRGVGKLETLLKTQVESSFSFFGNKLFSTNTTNPSALLKSYLPSAYGYMGQMAGSAEDMMRQQMMIYSVIDGIESKSEALGNAQNFALCRAYLQQRTSQETSAGLAQKTMIALKNVVEAVVYGLFIFVIPLAMIPAGWRFVGNWASMVMWVQMWAPLYAILNFIMNAAARSKGIGAITTAGGITIANSVGFSDLHADMAAQAGYLSLSVGALAYALVKGGASAMVILAGSVAGQIGGGVGRVTEDMLSGNYSFGNFSTGNVQANNSTFGQQMLSASYSSGAFTDNTGMVSSVTNADGSRTVNVANSNLRSALQWSESLSSTLTEQAQQSLTASKSSMQAWGETQSDAYRSALEFGSHMAQQKSYGDSVSQAEQASANAAFNTVKSHVTQFADEHRISEEKATQMLGRALASFNSKDTKLGQLFSSVTGTSFGLEGAYQKSSNDSDSKLMSEAKQAVQNASFQEALQKTKQYSQDSRFYEGDETGKRLGSSAASSFEKANQYRQETQAHLQQADSYMHSATSAKQNSASINASFNQEFVDWLPQQALPNSNASMGRHTAETILASQPEKLIPYQQRFLEERFGNMKGDLLSHPAGSMAGVQHSYERSKDSITKQSSQGFNQQILDQAKAEGITDESRLYYNEERIRGEVGSRMHQMADQIQAYQQTDIVNPRQSLQSESTFANNKGQGIASVEEPAGAVSGLLEPNTIDRSDLNKFRYEIVDEVQEALKSNVKAGQVDTKKLGIKNEK